MKQLLITAAIILSALFTQAQTYVRTTSLSFGYKESAGVRWTIQNEPAKILITAYSGVFTIYSKKVQVFHSVTQTVNTDDVCSWDCVDDENIKCSITIKSSKTNKNSGIFIVEYLNIIYYYDSYLEN